MPVASARPDQNPRAMASQSGPEEPWPTGARWRVQVIYYVSQVITKIVILSQEDDSAAAVVGSGRRLALNVEMESWTVK